VILVLLGGAKRSARG